MKVTLRLRRQLRMQDSLFVLLFAVVIVLLGWFSQRYHWEVDLTQGGRNSLSPSTRQLLPQVTGPVQIDAYARELEFSQTREQIGKLVRQYQRIKPDISLRFVNPDAHPEAVQAEGITVEGELVVKYQGRQQHLTALTEQGLSNTLMRLLRSGDRPVYFLSGHGERSPEGNGNPDLGLFAQRLGQAGLKTQTWNLAAKRTLPDDASLLVIASPQKAYLPGEVKRLQAYVEEGGNLLWLLEPDHLSGLDALASSLGVELLPGTIADPTGELVGISNAAFALVTSYPEHPVSRDLDSVTVLPLAAGLELAENDVWEAVALLTTSKESWSETGKLTRLIRYDAHEDIAGPLNVGYLLTRRSPQDPVGDGSALARQRLAVIGDGDFLSNTYLGNGGNLQLGLALVNWLTLDDEMLQIQAPAAGDTRLDLDQTGLALMGLVYLALLPLTLLLAGVVIWWRRRRR